MTSYLPATLSGDHLTIYLNDHLAGSTFGAELARRILGSNVATEFEVPLQELAKEIAEDRGELEQIIERLDRPRDQLKATAGWLAEKVGRLKPNGRLLGYSPLSRLLELEALSAGIIGKLAGWRALQTVAASEPRLDPANLGRLIERAEDQLARVAALHARAAELALPHP